MQTKIKVNWDVQCPACLSTEVDEKTGNLNIRAFKVCDDHGYWWSECLVCKEQGADDPWF